MALIGAARLGAGDEVAAGRQRVPAAKTARVPRYLLYDVAHVRPAGLDHQFRNLKWLLCEAHMTGRKAVLPPLALDPVHNFGVDSAWHWETYLDLEGSCLIDGGTAYPLPFVNALPARALSTLRLAPGSPLPASAEESELVERRLASSLFLRDVPLPGRRAPPRLRGVLRPRLPLEFRLRPSQRVSELAKPVAAALSARGRAYAAVHVRRGDRLVGPVRRATRPERVASALRAQGVPDGGTVFLLTDERDPAYRAALAARYDVVSAKDLPATAALAAEDGATAPDNYLLYAVEKAVMAGASIRIETLPGTGDEPVDATLVASWRARAYAALRLVRSAAGERAWGALAIVTRGPR